MRSRRTTFSTSIDFSKSVEKLVDEVTSHLDPNTSHQIFDRIESLKSFLNRFKFEFNKAPPPSYRIFINELDELAGGSSTTASREKEMEAALEKNHESISIGLVYNLIQMESSQLRLLSLQTILFLSHLASFATKFHQLNINLYIVRLIDLDLSWDETSMCFEYIRLITQMWPQHVDKSLVFCLLSALEDSKYRLNFFILETLLEIVVKKPSLACECSVFSDLITYVLNACTENEFVIQLIMQTLVRVCDDQSVRSQIPLFDLLSNLIAPIIDTAYVPFTYGPFYTQHKLNQLQNPNQNSTLYSMGMETGIEVPEPRLENIINASFTALASLMSSYSGLMCFLINDGQLVFTLLSPFSWYLQANKRDSDKRQALAEQLTTTSLRESSVAPETQLTRKTSDPKELQAKQKEICILNGLISFLYKIFHIEEISIEKLKAKALRCIGRPTSVGTAIHPFASDLIEDDLVNEECDSLFEPFENYSAQSNISNLEASGLNNSYISTSPNLAMCHRVFLLKAFIETRLMESLLDLYFGLPVSFLENCSAFASPHVATSKNLLAQYELLSLKCLNLFSELYYLSNKLLHNEYCIDDLDPDISKCPFTSNSKSIYNEMKKLSLIAYLRQLNYLEREKEVLIYVTDLNTKKESIRRGEMLPSDEIANLSFFAQQFLANSGHLSSKKYQQELEILNSTLSIDNKKSDQTEDYFQNIFSMVSNFIANEESAQTKEKRELKSRLNDAEKKLDEQLDATLILSSDPSNWNWIETIRLFELYLLNQSSLYPQFAPTRDAEILSKFRKKVLAESSKLIKVIKKLFDFLSQVSEPANIQMSQTHSAPILTSQISYSPRTTHPSLAYQSRLSTTANSSVQQSDQISCVGCFLVDFCIGEIQIENIAQNQFGSVIEFICVQFLQSVRQHLLNEFPLNMTGGNTRASVSASSNASSRSLGKDSMIANYLILLGHMSANPKGDLLLEHFKIYDLIVKIVEIHRDVAFIKLAVSTFNYYTSPKSRMILERVLCFHPPRSTHAAYNENKVYALKLILNLFRAHNLKFEAFLARVVFKAMLWALDEEAETPVMRFSNEQVLELAISSLEYFFNLRPDLLDRFLSSDADEMIKSVDEIAIKCGRGRTLTRSRSIRTKLEFLSTRMKMADSRFFKFSETQVESIIKWWYDTKKDVRHFQLVERNLFDANSINVNYLNEIDDRDLGSLDRDLLATPLTQTSITSFSLDDSSPINRSRSNTWNTGGASSGAKLYRRVNDPARNLSLFQANLGQIFMPFHINTSLVRHPVFQENHFTLSDFFEKKIAQQLKLVKTVAKDCEKASLTKLKSALWSLSALCVCENGLRLISHVSQKLAIFRNLFEFVCCFLKIAEQHPRLSIRATCYLCSNLLCKSSTGANLLGKLGWHTFQSNLFTPTRAFQTTMASLSSEQQDLSVASSIDLAVVIYNLNRSKLEGLEMKNIQKYYFHEFSSHELRFLHEISRSNLASKRDVDLMREYNHLEDSGVSGGVYFAENLTVPIRTSLLSPDDDYKIAAVHRQYSKIQFDESVIDSNSAKENCFFCCYFKKNEAEETKAGEEDEKLKLALDLISKFLFMLNVDKTKMKKLISLRKHHPSVFNFCLFYLVSVQYLSSYRIKFHVRKCVQELFSDLLRFNGQPSLDNKN